MPSHLTIAVDAMGGDNAPGAVIQGADLACKTLPDNTRFILFGDERKIEKYLKETEHLKDVCDIRHTDSEISNTDKPTHVLRHGRETSMALAIDAVASGDADCIVSSGNTGALMVLALMTLKKLPGIDRPAIAAPMPTAKGRCVALDLGANVECSEKNLVQFAIMGCVFASTVFGVHSPTVGILNIGEEAQKGNEVVKKTASMLSTMWIPGRFKGFVEGNDIGAGAVDVIVTDGFTGNIMLKTIEGTAKLIKNKIYAAAHSSLLSKIGFFLARPALKKMADTIDPRQYNGAMFLGLGGVCVKSHGSTDAIGFANAVGVAADLVRNRFNEQVAEDLTKIPEINGNKTPKKKADA